MKPTLEEYYQNPQHYQIISRNKIDKSVYSVDKIYPDQTRLYLYDGGKKLQNSIRTTLKPSEDKNNYYAVYSTIHLPFQKLQVPNAYISTAEKIMSDSLRTTKTVLSDIVLCNKFEMFATFTFSCSGCPYPCKQKKCPINHPHKKYQCKPIPCNCPPDICQRLDPEICKKRVSKWLNNQQTINGKFKYIIVPEWHEKGGLHFHAMLKNYNGKLIQAQHHRTKKDMYSKGQPIYTIQSYKLGYSTIKLIPQIELDHIKVSNYIKKYITKDMPQFKGRKRYWCSKGLLRPHKTTQYDKQEVLNNPYITKDDVYQHGNISIITIKHKLQTSPLGQKLGLQNGI